MSTVTSFLTNISIQGQKLSYVDTAPFSVNGTTYRGIITTAQSGTDFIITQRFTSFPFHNIQISESQFMVQVANSNFIPAEIKNIVGANQYFLSTINAQTTWFLRVQAIPGNSSNIDLTVSQSGFITNSSNLFLTISGGQLTMSSNAGLFNTVKPADGNIIIGSVSLSGGGGGGNLTLTPSGSLFVPYYIPFSSTISGQVTVMGTDVSGLFYNNNIHALTVKSVLTNKLGTGPAPDGGPNNIAIGDSSLATNGANPGENNIGLGVGTLAFNETGNYNIAIGTNAASSKLSGENNIAIGVNALFTDKTCGDTIAIGKNALYNFNTPSGGGDNIAIGTSAMIGNVVGKFNIAIGSSSLEANISGEDNIAIGVTACSYNTIGGKNIAIGNQALQSNVTSSNIAIGHKAAFSNISGVNNIAIGTEAMRYNSTGSGNVAIGNNSFYSNISGGNNIAIGPSSLFNNTGGSYNIGIGTAACPAVTTGSDNIGLGFIALGSNISGNNNIGIGRGSQYSSTNSNYNITMGLGSLQANTVGDSNIIIGYSGLLSTTGASGNIAIGTNVGNNYSGNESGNIIINNEGVVGDNNTIRIGDNTHKSAVILPALIRQNIPQLINGASVSLTAENLVSMSGGLLYKTTGASGDLLMPASDAITSFIGNVSNFNAFEFTIVNSASNSITIGSVSGVVLIGPVEVTPSSSRKITMVYNISGDSMWNMF